MQSSEPTNDTRDLLDVRRAAARARCSVTTIKRRIRSGELPATTLGGNGRKYLIAPADLEKILAPVPVSDEERMAALAREIAATAPKLSPERRARLAELLR